jgi:hypothetical protein
MPPLRLTVSPTWLVWEKSSRARQFLIGKNLSNIEYGGAAKKIFYRETRPWLW